MPASSIGRPSATARRQAYHQLRIGIKRLRYTVENFLPSLHAVWAKDLRDLQDALGEVHDFDVLWATLRQHPELTPQVRAHWRATLAARNETSV